MEQNKYYIENDPSKPLAEQAADKISSFIIDHKLMEGEKLPSEFELAKLINVGRSTIREAIKLLISKNIVEIRRGAGTFVCNQCGVASDPLGFSFVRDKEQLRKDQRVFRSMIEPGMASMAAANASKVELIELENMADEIERRILFGMEFEEEIRRFHLAIAKASHNVAIGNVLPLVYEKQPGNGEVTTYSEEERKECIQKYRMLMGALKCRNSQWAYEAMTLIVLPLKYN